MQVIYAVFYPYADVNLHTHKTLSHKAYQIDWLQVSADIDRKLFLGYRESKGRIGE